MIRWLLAVALCLTGSPGLACDLAGDDSIELETGVVLHYRIEPPPLRVAQHFSMQFRVCRAQQSIVLERFKVDALMPTHGHGMNYRPRIEIRPGGLVEATGLLFHMPGAWQIRVDLSYDGIGRQLSIDYRV